MKLHVAKQDDGFYQVSLTHGEDAPDGPTRTGVAVMSDVGLSIVTKLAEAAGIHADCGTTADPNAQPHAEAQDTGVPPATEPPTGPSRDEA